MGAIKKAEAFRFKQFSIEQDQCAMKVGTDGVLLGAWANVEGANAMLDIGAGTGVIAIMLGQRAPEAAVHAVEIDESSAKQAKHNMQNAPWADRMELFHCSIQDFVKDPANQPYDLIVSNPPFFSGGTISHNQNRNDVRHTVKLPHGDLLVAVRSLLAPDGKFCVVLPLIEGMRFKELAQSYQLFCTKVTKVRPKQDKAVERLLIQFERKDGPEETDELIIQKEGRNEWTDDYIALTKTFYLKM